MGRSVWHVFQVESCAGAAAGGVQGFLNTPVKVSTESHPGMPLLQAMWRVFQKEGVCAFFRGVGLMCIGNAFAAAAYFGCFNSSRVHFARWMHQLMGDRLDVNQLQPGVPVTHDVLGAGIVASRKPPHTVVNFDHSLRSTFSDRKLVKCQLCLGGEEEYSRRYVSRYIAPLSAGVFAGMAFVTVIHPFNSLRQWHAEQPTRSRSAPSDFLCARTSPAILFRGWLGKLPRSLIKALPLLVYSFTIVQPRKEAAKRNV